MFLVFTWNSPKREHTCKSKLSWKISSLAIWWVAVFVILVMFHRVSIWVDAESDYSYFLNKVILQLLWKVSQHFNFYRLPSLPCQISVFKPGVVIVHFKGEMLCSSIAALRNIGEAILLFVSNIISLASVIVLLVDLAAHCMLTSGVSLLCPLYHFSH